jgi:hypothetical protein
MIKKLLTGLLLLFLVGLIIGTGLSDTGETSSSYNETISNTIANPIGMRYPITNMFADYSSDIRSLTVIGWSVGVATNMVNAYGIDVISLLRFDDEDIREVTVCLADIDEAKCSRYIYYN